MRAQCLGLTGACAACSHCWPRLGSCQALIALTRRPLSFACHARFMFSAPAFCAWRRLPLICLKLLVGLCVRDGLAASFCVCRTSADSVEPLPRGSRAVAFPRWLHVLSCSTWLIVPCSCSIVASAACVRDGLASSVCVCRTSAASVELLPWGWRAVAFPLWLHVLRCSIWLIVTCSCSVLASASFRTSSPRDATRRMSSTELLCATQQRLRRSSIAAALQPSTQLVVFVASLLQVLLLLAAPRVGTRRHLEGGRELRAASRISSIAAASAPSQQQKQATAVFRDDERSTGALLLKVPPHAT